MYGIEYIKSEIEKLYKTNPSIRISISRMHPRLFIERSAAEIVGVYRNIFQVVETDGGKPPVRHTVQYTDVLIGQVVIEELNYTPRINNPKK